MKVTKYHVNTTKINKPLNIACVSDLHARKSDAVIDTLKKIAPDFILLAGDIIEVSNEFMRERNKNAMRFFEAVSKIAPVYYCFGNHEIYFSHASKRVNRVPNAQIEIENIKKIKAFGINIINDSFEKVDISEDDHILVGGLVCGRDKDRALKLNGPDLSFLDAYDKEDRYKILLCHYPHYYEEHLKDTSFDLIFAGHAHGGHWRIFGRGVYAPHQGLFPKYTCGIYDNRFIISRGCVNNTKPIPRFFNPCEVLQITVSPKK